MKKRKTPLGRRTVLGERTLDGPFVIPKDVKAADWELALLGVKKDTRTAKQRRFERRVLLRRQAANRG